MLWVQGFLVQLRQDDDENAQLDALSQLNELLSISNEESLSVFPVEQLVPVLVHSLLHAARFHVAYMCVEDCALHVNLWPPACLKRFGKTQEPMRSFMAISLCSVLDSQACFALDAACLAHNAALRA